MSAPKRLAALLPAFLAILATLPSAAPAGLLRYYFPPEKTAPRVVEADVCVYGANSGGIAAAVAAARAGQAAVIVNPALHLGGLTSGGLGHTDTGDKRGIGGISREFYQRVGRHYGSGAMVMNFEPHVAEAVYKELVAAAKIPVFHREFLASVEKSGARLVSLTTEGGLTVRAKMFIDASYEGDLMAKAGVSFHVGREGNGVYGETLNGAYVSKGHQFLYPVDPYVVAGDPKSGLLPGIEDGQPVPGAGDHRVQAYNFRVCMTDTAANRVPFQKPAGYNRADYELLARYLAAGWDDVFYKFDRVPNGKTDTNNHGAVSTDFIGANYGWPEGSYAEREKLFQAHVTWQRGLFWFLANDPAVPAHIRAAMAVWGLAKDEFADTENWPRQLYVRESRRMVSDYVMTEHDCRWHRTAPDSVGLASYGMDSHNCRRFVRDGRVLNEGNVQVGCAGAYPVSYRSIVPKKSECENLLVPVCLAASHIAYGSIRMEPVFMILGESSGIAADLAIRGKLPLQDVPYAELRAALLKAGQVLDTPAKK
ncbi:MAG: FAD-dependent oxidoreductase [Opitutaceae bacterium]|jgi:hypothetical protein|nr:FAD-dependent oxidoreductase [Opitutaceae bacterium]